MISLGDKGDHMNRDTFSNPFFGSIGRRIKRKRDIIVTEDGKELEFLVVEESEFDTQGDFSTTQTVYSKILPDGWRVGPRHVVAVCKSCGNFVSFRALRYCRCGAVLCANCSRLWENNEERRYVCQDCYRSLRRKKILGFIGRLLISPFVERKEA
jgi:hypothetical protein